jgi:hypothetical protein
VPFVRVCLEGWRLFISPACLLRACVLAALTIAALATAASPSFAQDQSQRQGQRPTTPDTRPDDPPENFPSRLADPAPLDPPLIEFETRSESRTLPSAQADPRTNLTIHPDAGSITYQQWILNVTSESTPNAVPISSPAYGDPSGNCTYSQSALSLLPCYNPLRIAFDVVLPANFAISTSSSSPSTIPIASLGGTGSSNLLTITNSINSTDGGVSNIAVTAYCSGTTLNVAITLTNEDNSVFHFTGSALLVIPCGFSVATSGSLTSSTTGDTGNFQLTPQYVISGTYQGNFSDNDTWFNALGSSTFTSTVNTDFSATGTVSVAAGQICSAQTSTLSLSSAGSLAQANGIQSGLPGISVGDTLELAASNATTLIWFVASDENYIGNTLGNGYIFVTGYVVSGTCAGTYFYDAPFRANITRPRGPHPVRHLPALVHPVFQLAFRR